MNKLLIDFRLTLHRWFTSSQWGYLVIGIISFGILALILVFARIFNQPSLQSLYYFFNFNYPASDEPAITPKQKWKFLVVGIVGMIIVSGLLIMLVTSGVQRWVERIREGQIVFNKICNHYVMIGYDPQSINIINTLPIDNKHRLIILTKKNPIQIRTELKASLENEDKEKNIVLYAGGRDRVNKLNLKEAIECYLLIEGNDWESQYTRSLSVLREVAQYAAERDKPLRTKMLITNIEAFNLFGQLDMPEFAGIEALDIHPFNLYNNWARLLWSYNGKKNDDGSYFYDALDFEPIENTDKHVHLVIVGFNSMGRALWQEAVRIAHYPNFVEPQTADQPCNNKTTITVIDPQADEMEHQIRIQYPFLSQITDIDFDFRKAKIEDDDIRKELVNWANNKNKMLTIAICISDPDTSLSLAISLPEALYYNYKDLNLKPTDPTKPNGNQKISNNPSRTRILVRQSVKKPVNELLNPNSKHFSNMKFFGDYSEAYSHELLDDYMAICVNGIYNGYGNGGKKLGISFYDDDYSRLNTIDIDANYDFWESIWYEHKSMKSEQGEEICLSTSEQNKLSTRYQIDHYRTSLAIQERDFSEEQIEHLAQTEHLRWSAERTLAGWRQIQGDEKRVNALKIHTDIMPYKDLDMKEKIKDRNVVRFAQHLAQTKKEYNSKNKNK